MEDIKKNSCVMVARKLLIEQRKTILYAIAAFLGFNLIMGIWSGWLGIVPGRGVDGLYSFVTPIACMVVASKMMFEMTTKQGRISLFMTPASAATKFFTRLICIIVGMTLLIVAGYFVLNLSDIFMHRTVYAEWPKFDNPFSRLSHNDVMLLCLALSTFILILSAFIFGAVVWPKKSFLKTVGVLFIIQSAMTIAPVLMYFSNLDFEIIDFDAFMWSIICIELVLAGIVTYLSYFMFKNSKVI